MVVNGETLKLSELDDNSINALLNYYGLSPERVAIEIDGRIIKKADYNSVELNEENNIEIIHFVGGG